jgi:hypothetical protein
VLAHFRTAFLDFLGFFVIQAGEFVARLADYMAFHRAWHGSPACRDAPRIE